jgi:sugar lactone lactonase YvrE
MYWSDAGKHVIRRAELDGSGVEDIIVLGNHTFPRGLAIDQLTSKVYWAEMGSHRIMRASLDGADVETVVTTYKGPDGLALDGVNGNIYWTDVEGRVQWMNLEEGGFPEGIVEASFTHREGIAVDPEGGWIYWPCADKSYAMIHKAHLDGGSPMHLIDDDDKDPNEPMLELFGPRGVALDVAAGMIYWSDTIADRIQRADFEGHHVEDIVTANLTSAIGIAIDAAAGKLYWTDRGLDTLTSRGDAIKRANLDGSSVEVLVAGGHAEPRSIVLAA